jgi:hypothetical protein
LGGAIWHAGGPLRHSVDGQLREGGSESCVESELQLRDKGSVTQEVTQQVPESKQICVPHALRP